MNNHVASFLLAQVMMRVLFELHMRRTFAGPQAAQQMPSVQDIAPYLSSGPIHST